MVFSSSAQIQALAARAGGILFPGRFRDTGMATGVSLGASGRRPPPGPPPRTRAGGAGAAAASLTGGAVAGSAMGHAGGFAVVTDTVPLDPVWALGGPPCLAQGGVEAMTRWSKPASSAGPTSARASESGHGATAASLVGGGAGGRDFGAASDAGAGAASAGAAASAGGVSVGPLRLGEEDSLPGGFAASTSGFGILAFDAVFGSNPLLRAAAAGDVSTVRDLLPLLSAQAVKTEGSNGHTALTAACSAGHWEVAHHLLEAGAALHGVTSRGYTPLTEAVRGNHVAVVEGLVREWRADVTQRIRGGQTALSLAKRLHHDRIASFLADHTSLAAERRRLFIAITLHDSEAVAALLKHGVPHRTGHVRSCAWQLRFARRRFRRARRSAIAAQRERAELQARVDSLRARAAARQRRMADASRRRLEAAAAGVVPAAGSAASRRASTSSRRETAGSERGSLAGSRIGRPADFDGGAGDWHVTEDVDRTDLQADEAETAGAVEGGAGGLDGAATHDATDDGSADGSADGTSPMVGPPDRFDMAATGPGGFVSAAARGDARGAGLERAALPDRAASAPVPTPERTLLP